MAAWKLDLLADERVDDIVELRPVATASKAYEIANKWGRDTVSALACGNSREVEDFVDLLLGEFIVGRLTAGSLSERHARSRYQSSMGQADRRQPAREKHRPPSLNPSALAGSDLSESGNSTT